MKRLAVTLLSVFTLISCATTSTTTDGTPPIKKTKGNFRVGVILPLSGKFKLYGESVLHGIECAAGVVAPCTSPLTIELVVKDSKGDPGVAATAVEELATQDKVMTILGPLMSKEVDQAAAKAQALQIPLVSLSQKEGLTEVGDYIFRVALTAQSQVTTVVEYAAKTKGLKRFGILYPRNPYGESFRSAFATAVQSAGGTLVAEKAYGEEIVNVVEAVSQQDSPIKKAGVGTDGTYQGPGAKDSGASVGGSTSARPRVPVITGVEAIFIPDSYRAVGNILKYSPPNTFKGVMLLGNNRWNQSELVDASSMELEGAVFVDAFFLQSGDVEIQQFIEMFRQAYNQTPTILEAQGYDAARLVIQAIESGGRRPSNMRTALAKLKNVRGITGRMSVDGSRDVRRPLILLTVAGGHITQLK